MTDHSPTTASATFARWPVVPTLCVLLGAGLATGPALFAAEPTTPLPRQAAPAPAERPIVTLRGRVVCLPEEMHRLHGTELPTRHDHTWALRTTNGLYYVILPGRYSESIRDDERVRARELQLRVRILPNTQAIEVLTVHSVRDGVVQDLYYYCDVCAIKSVSPAVCACCQAPVELMEGPLNGDTP